MDLRKLLKDQSELRERLLQVIFKKKLSIASASKEIGIAYNTLSNFLKKDKNLDLLPLGMILDYVEQNK